MHRNAEFWIFNRLSFVTLLGDVVLFGKSKNRIQGDGCIVKAGGKTGGPRFFLALGMALLVAVIGIAVANQMFAMIQFILLGQTVGLRTNFIELFTLLFLTVGALALATVVTGKSWRHCLIFFVPALAVILLRSAYVVAFESEGFLRLVVAGEFMLAAAAVAGVFLMFRRERAKREPVVPSGNDYRQRRA